MINKDEVIKRLIANELIDKEHISYYRYETEINEERKYIKTDIDRYTKENLLKAEQVLGAKDFEVGYNSHMEMTYVIFYL